MHYQKQVVYNQSLYYVPADSQVHLANVVEGEQHVRSWTALSLYLFAIALHSP